MTNEMVRQQLINNVDRLLSVYPQYKNYFDNWRLAVAKKHLKFKSGEIQAGTLVLANSYAKSFGELQIEIVDCETGCCKVLASTGDVWFLPDGYNME